MSEDGYLGGLILKSSRCTDTVVLGPFARQLKFLVTVLSVVTRLRSGFTDRRASVPKFCDVNYDHCNYFFKKTTCRGRHSAQRASCARRGQQVRRRAVSAKSQWPCLARRKARSAPQGFFAARQGLSCRTEASNAAIGTNGLPESELFFALPFCLPHVDLALLASV